ncbi:MAG: acyltransferase family protein [Blautia sp.]|nr:acyltransferase family protein [Blautia sp.]
MSGKRDSNIELLRIITMILIVGHHYVFHGLYNSMITGGVTNLWSNGGTGRAIASLLYPGGRVGNYIFFMLSGYFLINRTESIKIRKVINIVIFYGITLSLVTGLLGLMGILPEGVRFSGIIKNSVIGLFTPITGVWWFITAYILLMLLVPIINGYISKLTLKGYFVSLALIWLPSSVIDYMFNSPLIEIEMAVYFYMLGGFLRKSNLAKKHRSLIWALFSAIAWGCSAGLNYLANAGADNNIVFKVIAKFSTALDLALHLFLRHVLSFAHLPALECLIYHGSID